MRIDLLLAFVVMALPFPAQRGTIDTVTVASRNAETGQTVTMTVRGSNPCGAVEINPGDGKVVTHPISQVPATVTHTYLKPGRYQIRARGMGNCDGEATASITVTGEELPDPTTGGATPTERRETRRPEEPLSARGTTATIDADYRWTPTGVTVREGELVRLEASGSVVMAPGTEPVGPEGSARGRVGNAPFPDRPAGALIAKIGEDGEPMFIGSSRHTFRANRSGQLLLGVNDDYFDDNTGQFRVTIAAADQRVGTSGTTGQAAPPRAIDADFPIDEDVTVRATDQWTDTGIALRSGDILRLDSSGSIRLTRDAGDSADPTGSRSRVAPNAPFPNRPAGALIARIGNGEPIFVGARRQNIRVMQDGDLWLGVNDDYFGDNGGEFLVRVTVRPARR